MASLDGSAVVVLGSTLEDSPQSASGKSTEPSLHTFFLAKDDSKAFLNEVPAGAIDPLRHKRPHAKSKKGCSNCRRRRVKCDEKLPSCSHCARRDEECEWIASHNKLQIYGVQRNIPPRISQPPLLGNADSTVNMLHMKLFHHFETSTRHTMCFVSVWKEALGWSLQYEGLMQAILGVSARHLAYLNPEDPTYSVAAASHYAQALSIFRTDISQKFTTSNVDIFMATAVLIYFQLWTETEFLVTDSEGPTALDLSRDGLYRLANGLVEIFMSAGPFMYEKPSSFITDKMHSPRRALNIVAGLSQEDLESFHSFFSYSRPLHYQQLSVTAAFNGGPLLNVTGWVEDPISDDDANFIAAHGDFVSRLATLLPFLPELNGPGYPKPFEQVMPDLTRYVFTFFIMTHGYAEKTINRQDPKGLLMLYHFYRAVRILLNGPNCWWTHKRARLLEALLEDRLQLLLDRDYQG